MEPKILAQRWQLVAPLGKGGMGTVWRAMHVELMTPAAVKLIDEAIARDPNALLRFKREAQAAASLRSTHIVQILDYGIDEGRPYIAMELLEGENLANRIQRVGCLEPQQVARLLSQVGKAVGRAHQLGIIHRDLKPDNVFICQEGADEIVKVLDFGIAKAGGTLRDLGSAQTATGAVLGTPYYMSPEQTSGRRSVDHRTDIWAFAVMAYECLVGARPFEGETFGGIALAICMEPIPTPSQVAPVPAGFDEWFARGTLRDPEARFQSIEEAAAELSRVCLAGLPAVGEQTGPEGWAPPLAGAGRWASQSGSRGPMSPKKAGSEPGFTDTITVSSITVDRGGRRHASPVLIAVTLGGAALAVVVLMVVLMSQGQQTPHSTTTSPIPEESATHTASSAVPPGTSPKQALGHAVSPPLSQSAGPSAKELPAPEFTAAEDRPPPRSSKPTRPARDTPKSGAPSPGLQPQPSTSQPSTSQPATKKSSPSEPRKSVPLEERLGF